MLSSQDPGRLRLELWAGLECSVVRIGDQFRDQLVETGHPARSDDLERIANLGVRTIRYPILWERVSPDDPEKSNWAWHDAQMAALRELGFNVIVGLVHHGSGPRYTDLLDPWFATGLAQHAARVARRYPWVELFTPVNEPLTTARFSGLYGHWFPHSTDDASFLRMLFGQCRAVSMAMSAIREITPSARLVQTEDLGKVFSTHQLQYQADYENERRWLSFDLLCGRVDAHHRFYDDFVRAGVAPSGLDEAAHVPTPPDCLGINHYLTSERYLDHAWWHYPPEYRASNGRQEYADVDAVRVLHLEPAVGPEARLREAWQRYELPIAITEAHHASTPEEQARWLLDVWHAAEALRAEGADIRAVTAWSLFGAIDWNSLLTRTAGFYEPGAFDIRQSPPSPTLLADVIIELCRTGHCDWQASLADGWWRRPGRSYSSGQPERRAV